MTPITHKKATEIARAALDRANAGPAQYRLSTLHDEVNEALVELGYRPVTVLAMDGLSVRSIKGVAGEIYRAAKRAKQ